MKKTKSQIGKANRAAGARFERKVRAALESKGWTVDKWSNNVEFIKEDLLWPVGKLIPAKRKYNPYSKVMAIGTGFPDFICFRHVHVNDLEKVDLTSIDIYKNNEFPFLIHAVECKSNGYLTKEEKEKCKWLLDNQKFSKILIASKGTKRGQIVYKEFEGYL